MLPDTITIEVLEEPKLRQRPAASVVIAVIAVSLLAIILIVFVIYYIKVSLNRKGVSLKQLMKHDKRSLKKSLHEKLLCVCSNNPLSFQRKVRRNTAPSFLQHRWGLRPLLRQLALRRTWRWTSRRIP